MKILKTIYKVIKDDFKDARMLTGYAMDLREGGEKSTIYGNEMIAWAMKRLDHAKNCMGKLETYMIDMKNTDTGAIAEMLIEDMKSEYEDVEKFIKSY